MNYVDGYVLNGDYQIYTGDLISGNTYYTKNNNNEYVVTSDTQRQGTTVYYEYVPTGPSLYLPGESDFSTDFIGFSYKGVHCSELNFWRTSDGSRYDDVVIPNFSDTTAQMPGHDGILYWESFDSNRTFQIPIAFDSMSEVQYRRFRQVFNGKDYGDLIFDEAPYKRYSVKVQSPPQLKTICFMEDGQRVYKGEGSIVFVAYYPYARQVYKYLDSYSDELYPNKDEWKVASQMRRSSVWDGPDAGQDESGDSIISGETPQDPPVFVPGDIDSVPTWNVRVYNAGDIPTDWKAYWDGDNLPTRIELNRGGEPGDVLGVLKLKPITLKGDDVYIRVNSATNLIEGCDSNYKPTGTLYNEYIVAGDFFKIPSVHGVVLDPWYKAAFRFKSYNTPSGEQHNDYHVECNKIEYDYLYY